MEQVWMKEQLLPKDTLLECIVAHEDGSYTVGKRTYRVASHQVVGNYAGIRLRDDRRQRKDFNFIPTSKNYIWKYFKLVKEM